jgi:diguanylate cyclase (GGDEF)-like protein
VANQATDKTPRRLSSGARLFVVYAAVSLLPVASLGMVVNSMVRREIDTRALTEAISEAKIISASAIQPALGTQRVKGQLPTLARVQLVAARSSLRGEMSVLKLRIRTPSGTIVFDADRPNDAPQVVDDDEVVQAATGRPVATLTRLNADVIDRRSPLGPAAVETYVAIRRPSDKKAIAVLEVYLPYKPFASEAAASKRRLTAALMAGLVVLWCVLAIVSWSVTRRLRLSARENAWLAHRDQLTGLRNRLAFAREIELAGRAGIRVWTAVVDVARFREVNETVGHENGDAFLRQIAGRLRAVIEPNGVVARLGGDQFGILWPDDSSVSRQQLMSALWASVARPIDVADIGVSVELTVGIANSDQVDGNTDVLRAADLAVHAGKEAGVSVMDYAPDLDHFDPDRLALAGELGKAILSDQLVLYYQPKLNLVTGQVHSVEALVRWEHPTRGLLQPGSFIDVAETTSLFRPLTEWVVAAAAKQMKQWRHIDPPLTMSVNISARSLADHDLPRHLLRTISEADVPLRTFQIEITETSIIADPVRAKKLLRRVHDAGVRISLDDFGQGATSLVSLTDLPLDEIKIDRSFVFDMERSDDRRSVVEFVIALGRKLGLTVVAEGIETELSATLLTSMGCDEGQGYLFCRPLPADEFEEWLRDHNAMLDEVSRRSDATGGLPEHAEDEPTTQAD